jgi:hypothetical protein
MERATKRVKRPRLTRLGEFIRDHQIIPNELANVSGISRQHLLRLRYGHSEPTRPVMVWLTLACSRLLDWRSVRVTELFDLGDGAR